MKKAIFNPDKTIKMDNQAVWQSIIRTILFNSELCLKPIVG